MHVSDRSLRGQPRAFSDMQSPPGNPELPNVVRLCGFIKNIIEEYINSHQELDETDIEPFRLEVQTLHHLLVLIEKIRAANEPRLDVEEFHLRDINGPGEPWDLNTPTFTVPRFYISFYTRTIEVSLKGINL
ncbi:MAG: hypothetical protein Q9225_006518 [Loekoesia sp. 1 TL-2023]